MDFDNFDHSDLEEVYDRVTGPVGGRIRVFQLGAGAGYYEGKLLIRLCVNSALDALVIERQSPEFGTVVQTIRWAAIESVAVLPENPEN